MTDAPRFGSKSEEESPISRVVGEAQTLASNVAASAQDTALRMAEQQKAAAADQVDEVARTLDSAAERVEQILPEAARYVRSAASGVHRASSAIRDQSIEDILEMGLDYARRRPGTFFAGSAVLGFAIARFLKASEDRRLEAQAGSAAARNRRAPGARSGAALGQTEHSRPQAGTTTRTAHHSDATTSDADRSR